MRLPPEREPRMSIHSILGYSVAVAACSAPTMLSVSSETPREFGAVRWQHRLEPALEGSAASGRPVLLLLQEVPG